MREGVRGTPDVSAMAALDAKRLFVLLWHYHDDDVSGPIADVTLRVASLPKDLRALRLNHYRIDAEHSNAYEVWRAMGEPKTPTAEQYGKLVAAGQLEELRTSEAFSASQGHATVEANQGSATVVTRLPRQAVSLLVFSWQ